MREQGGPVTCPSGVPTLRPAHGELPAVQQPQFNLCDLVPGPVEVSAPLGCEALNMPFVSQTWGSGSQMTSLLRGI